MRYRLCAILMSASVSSAACAQQPSPSQFTGEMIHAFQAQNPKAIIKPKPGDSLAIVGSGIANQHDLTINLDRIYRYCLTASAKDCLDAKNEFIIKISSASGGKIDEKSNLRVIVRDEQYILYIREMFKNSKKNDLPEFRPIGGGLYEILDFDSANSIKLADISALAKLQLTAAEAWTLGENQTYTHLPKLPITNLLEKDAVAFEAKEYLGSLLTQRENWAVWSKAVGPEMFVTVVSDQFVFVGKLPNGPKLDQFAKTVADDCSHQQRCISPHIYRFSDGQWVVADNPPLR